jgi:hypothetical protein
MSHKDLTRPLFVAFALLTLAAPAAPSAADPSGEKAQTRAALPGQDEMMAAMMKYATPGPNHDLIKSLEGSWKTVTKTWMGPGEPTVTEGINQSRMILGGRFLMDELRGEFMGKPYEGFGITGYDLQDQQFVTIWADVLATKIMVSTGQLDGTGKVITYKGMVDDPLTGKAIPYRITTEITGHDKHIFTMYGVHDGVEVKEMEITYTRN